MARYGDTCNLFDLPGTGFEDDLARKLDVLRAHCHAVGRDYSEIEKTTATLLDFGDRPRDGVRRFVDHLTHLAAIGIDQAIIGPRQPWDPATLDLVAEVLPDVHAIVVASDPDIAASEG